MSIFRTPFGVFLLFSGATIVTLLGLSALKDLIAPLLLAIMLAIIVRPIIKGLQNKGLPQPLAMIGVTLVLFLASAGILAFFYVELQQLVTRIPHYQALLSQRFITINTLLQQHGVDSTALFQGGLAPSAIGKAALKLATAILTQSAALLLFILLLLTLTLDYDGFSQGFSGHVDPKSRIVNGIAHLAYEIQVHFHLMTIGNLISAIAIGGVYFLFRLDFPLLWAVLTFFLSYIPRFGILLSFIPPTILAFVLFGPSAALMLLVLAFVFNGLTDNFISPRLAGKGLGLRTTTVIVSATIWLWILGPLGALLAIPMTLVLRALLASSPETLPIAYAISTNEYHPEEEDS